MVKSKHPDVDWNMIKSLIYVDLHRINQIKQWFISQKCGILIAVSWRDLASYGIHQMACSSKCWPPSGPWARTSGRWWWWCCCRQGCWTRRCSSTPCLPNPLAHWHILLVDSHIPFHSLHSPLHSLHSPSRTLHNHRTRTQDGWVPTLSWHLLWLRLQPPQQPSLRWGCCSGRACRPGRRRHPPSHGSGPGSDPNFVLLRLGRSRRHHAAPQSWAAVRQGAAGRGSAWGAVSAGTTWLLCHHTKHTTLICVACSRAHTHTHNM